MRTYEYALLRASPRVERGEYVNIGVVLYCQADDFLTVRLAPSRDRLLLLHGAADVDGILDAAGALERICAGEGPAGKTSLGQRFRWLTAPRSTVLHAGPVHSGLTVDAEAEVERLLDALVR